MRDEVQAQAIGLRPGRAEEDLRLHASPWTEVTAALRHAGLHDHSIHRQEAADLLVQRRVTGPDPAAALRTSSHGEALRPRREITAACRSPLPGHAGWAPLREVFRLD